MLGVNLGAAGERAAARFLRRLGYRIAARNYRCRSGEIDLIAVDGDTIVFAEVKTRRHDESADPEANVTYQKRLRLTRAAKTYLSAKSAQNQAARFDVLAVVLPATGQPAIEHFVDAFGPTPR
ncbi:MAG: YraN family protein [bacterium]|nr:YraN family protein [bacterium]